MGANEGTPRSRAGQTIRRPSVRRPRSGTDPIDDQPLTMRWQDGPWMGRYPLDSPPDEENEPAHRPARR